jgi:hypothetical protein
VDVSAFEQRLLPLLQSFFQLKDPLSIKIDLPDYSNLSLPKPRFQFPSASSSSSSSSSSTASFSFCTDNKYDRLSHSLGKSLRDILRHFAFLPNLLNTNTNNKNNINDETKQSPNRPKIVTTVPDYVAYVSTEQQIHQLFDYCSQNHIAVVTFGGGTSVVGGVEFPTEKAHTDKDKDSREKTAKKYRGFVSLDLSKMNQVCCFVVSCPSFLFFFSPISSLLSPAFVFPLLVRQAGQGQSDSHGARWYEGT